MLRFLACMFYVKYTDAYWMILQASLGCRTLYVKYTDTYKMILSVPLRCALGRLGTTFI